MRLSNHQKLMVVRATKIVRKIFESGGTLENVTAEEAALLLDVMAIIEENEIPDEGQEFVDLIDKNVKSDED